MDFQSLQEIDFSEADIYVLTLVGIREGELVDTLRSQFVMSPIEHINEKGLLRGFSKSIKTGEMLTQLFVQAPEHRAGFTNAKEYVYTLLKERLNISYENNGRVQIIVTTADYFFQSYFGLAAAYNEKFCPEAPPTKICFVTSDGTAISVGSQLSELNHNPISQEFDKVYDLEQSLIYGDDKNE